MPRNRAVILVTLLFQFLKLNSQQTALRTCTLSRNNMARKTDYLYEEDLEVFADMMENGNFDEEEFTNEYC